MAEYFNGGPGDDNKNYLGNDVLIAYGKGGNDFLWGNNGADFLDGGAGNDTVKGWSGDDLVYGGSGNDLLAGEAGNDFLNGYSGSSTEYDTMSGGAGSDTFSLGYNGSSAYGVSIGYLGNGYANITDFNPQEGDKIRLGGDINSYSLATQPVSGTTSTVIKYNGDIVGVLKNVSGLDIHASYFSFAGGHYS